MGKSLIFCGKSHQKRHNFGSSLSEATVRVSGISDVSSRTYLFPRNLREINKIPLIISLLCTKEIPTICIAAGCHDQKDEAQGILQNVSPCFEDDRPEAKRKRKKWVDFVKQKRAITCQEICRWALAFFFNLV